MNLKTYVKKSVFPPKQLAAMLEITQNYFYTIVSGIVRPSKWLALRIEKLTEGKVKAKSLRTANSLAKTPTKKSKKGKTEPTKDNQNLVP